MSHDLCRTQQQFAVPLACFSTTAHLPPQVSIGNFRDTAFAWGHPLVPESPPVAITSNRMVLPSLVTISCQIRMCWGLQSTSPIYAELLVGFFFCG